ncbi:MAG: GAF domain-containing protein, partial [Planctomycetota bacterium]
MYRTRTTDRSEQRARELTESLSPPQSPVERHLEAVLQISRAIGSIMDVSELVPLIMRQVTSTFQADRSSLFLPDPARRQLRSCVAQGLEGWSQELVIDDDYGLCGKVYQTMEPELISDVLAHASFGREIADAVGYLPRAMMVVPVMHRPNRCDGVLQVMDDRVGHFQEADLELLEAIAVIVSISLENARLYEAQKRQFESFVRA